MEKTPSPPETLSAIDRHNLTSSLMKIDYSALRKNFAEFDHKYSQWDLQSSYDSVATHPLRYLLMSATSKDREYIPMIKALVARGLNAGTAGKNNDMRIPPPLYYALKNNLPEAVALMLAHGADPNEYMEKYEERFPVFFSAPQPGENLKITKMLLAAGASINRKSSAGQTIIPYLLTHQRAFSDREVRKCLKLFMRYGYQPAPTPGQSRKLLMDNIRVWVRADEDRAAAVRDRASPRLSALAKWTTGGYNLPDRKQAARMQRWARWLGGQKRPLRDY